jgi:hypothetical protein
LSEELRVKSEERRRGRELKARTKWQFATAVPADKEQNNSQFSILKAAIERGENQTGLSSSEREQARTKFNSQFKNVFNH